jgi:hypothetical protein
MRYCKKEKDERKLKILSVKCVQIGKQIKKGKGNVQKKRKEKRKQIHGKWKVKG